MRRDGSDRHAEIVAALSEASFYPHGPASVQVRETHTSQVFIAGELVYKLKKPVRFEFLDYSTLAIRARMCEEEVRLNRRLAPSLYLGVRSVVDAGGRLALGGAEDAAAIEYLVEMRRFDDRQTLAARLTDGSAGVDEIREVAERIAAFHAAAERIEPAGDPRGGLKRATDETFASLLELSGASDEADVAAAQRFSNAFLVSRRETLLGRAAAGLVRDGHGDLRAEHVVLGDPIEIVDCIEFDPALRREDVAADLGFLVMDLHRLGAPDLAQELVHAYRAHGGDPGDDALVAFHAAQRAWVRAKVELLRARQLESTGEDARARRKAARELFALGQKLAWHARRPLLLAVCGLSGTGKSHLASALSEASGLEVINSDVVRKRLAGLDAADRARPEHYTAAFSESTYAELGRLAAAELERSGGVLIDATFRRAAERQLFRQAAGGAARHARFVECLVPDPLRLERVQRRVAGTSASDATLEVARSQTFEPLAEAPAERHLPLRADRSTRACLTAIEEWLEALPGERSDAGG